MIKLVALNARYIHSCPAIFQVLRELEKHLPEVRADIMQLTINDPYFATLLRIAEGRPSAVFFSVYVWNSAYIKRLIGDLVRITPLVRIVLGGPQAPFLAGASGEVLPANCTVVRGEIEGVGPVFYRDLDQNCLAAVYEAARGPAFAAPYQDGDFDHELKNRQIYYESSRGCPFSCAYCISSLDRGVRYKEISLVEKELDGILRHQPRVIRFVDRTFNARPARALAIWRYLAARPEKCLYHFEIAPELFSAEMFAFLETLAAGRFQFEIGIQSTNPPTLAAVDRSADFEVARRHISRLAALDRIHLHVDLILGLPYETAATFRKSFNDVFALAPHHVQMGLLKVLPGTPLGRKQAEFGLISCTEPPYEIMATRWLDLETMDRLYWFGQCVEAFHNNRFFRTVMDYLRRRGEDAFAFFARLLEVCRQHRFFELAPTQELMSTMLLALAGERADQQVFKELLVFDWLRSGHRFLPDHLPAAPLHLLKNRLWKTLPQNWPGFYDYQSRDEFFKQTIFVEFAAETLRETGLGSSGAGGCVGFRPEREEGVFDFRKTMLIG